MLVQSLGAQGKLSHWKANWKLRCVVRIYCVFNCLRYMVSGFNVGSSDLGSTYFHFPSAICKLQIHWTSYGYEDYYGDHRVAALEFHIPISEKILARGFRV